jgi:nitrogen fixation/metabolism regulation signal transduction histidine kinase
MMDETKPKSFARIAALIVLICIVVEAGIMLLLHEFTTLSPIMHAVIDVSIVSVTVLGCLYTWVLPALSSSRRQASDQTRLLEALIDAIPVPVF